MTTELDNLLDATLDDIADLPSFQPFPVGAHRVLATFGQKEINGKGAITLDFKLIETVEYANPQDAETSPTKEGDASGTMFMLDNEYGAGNFKKCAAPFAEMVGSSGLRAIVEGVQDVECLVLTGLRSKKDDATVKYLDVKEITVL